MAQVLLANPADFPPHLRGGVLCVGNFDGVHAGHAKMLFTGKAEALRRNCAFTVMTFDPHPAAILRPALPRVPLTTIDQRRELLLAFKPDALIVIPTTRDFLAITAEDFLLRIVHETLAATLMVEGPTFTYGKGARGTVETLQHNCHHIETLIVPTQQATLSDLTRVNVSSSLVRWLVENGRARDAAICLGRPYALRGEVVQGQHRGKELGFPTANVAATQLLPAAGIYAGCAVLPDGRAFRAAISVGNNPTFAGKITTVEAFILDFSGDLYGQIIEVQFLRWIREMLHFDDIAPLVQRIQRDVAETRATIQLH